MPIVTEVEELVVPLRGNSKGIFEEGDDDQEPANSWYISALHQFRVLISTSLLFVSNFPSSSQVEANGEKERTA